MLVLNSQSGSYVYNAENYAQYKAGAKAVIQSYLTAAGKGEAKDITIDRSV